MILVFFLIFFFIQFFFCWQAPDKYWKYLTFTGGYHLYNSAHYCPLMSPPASLTLSVMRELFNVQERDRWQLKARQVVEREKLVVRCESEVLRVYGKAAYLATGVYVSIWAYIWSYTFKINYKTDIEYYF